ncbi:copper homeostasis protein CutC [Terrisporobacter sp.]|uniref:copper homeostasis protein CutC n=1 Tax=Terrisporobacter sp. TaxID=1965305 RepID=UPI0026342DDF|nr:copper homeostasis protein CutC [Terrisporobacter sp.]
MLEIIGMCVEDAKAIEFCGGNRIELVSALTEGGLTPGYATIEKVVNSVKIPVNVMVRNHAKSFTYSDYDIEVMKKDIEIIKSLGANGIVLGMLDKFNNIDEENLKELLDITEGLDVTFHKAIDETNVKESIKVLNKYDKITNILTSGGLGNIADNTDNIKYMLNNSNNINILLGGGLTFDNIESIRNITNATDFHFGTAVRVDKSPFGDIDENKLTSLVKIINNK